MKVRTSQIAIIAALLASVLPVVAQQPAAPSSGSTAEPSEADAPTNAAHPQGFWKRFVKAYADDWHPAPDNGEAPKPVSYTHLRAHETGRNLVCRLLLEKKKNKK